MLDSAVSLVFGKPDKFNMLHTQITCLPAADGSIQTVFCLLFGKLSRAVAGELQPVVSAWPPLQLGLVSSSEAGVVMINPDDDYKLLSLI